MIVFVPLVVGRWVAFAVLFPRRVAERRSADRVAIVNLADDSWVEDETADSQLVAAAGFRAIEQRLTLIRVAHGGLSVVIDPFGRRVASLPPDRVATFSVEARAIARPSLFERGMILLLPLVVGGTAGWASGTSVLARRRERASIAGENHQAQ